MSLPSCELAQNAPCRATGFSIDVIGINGRLFTLEGPASRTGHRTGFSCGLLFLTNRATKPPYQLRGLIQGLLAHMLLIGLPLSFSLHKLAR